MLMRPSKHFFCNRKIHYSACMSLLRQETVIKKSVPWNINTKLLSAPNCHELSGVVESVAPSVGDVKVGDAIYALTEVADQESSVGVMAQA